ncbi:glucose/sorbosone family PQQ-dependent dehydrogenase [Devosia aurantiaca]|uniref:L-sorbosone dehydrogenase n=1 Tax=Devosia aurantiaca TaxID=2714858 RepID=A0A6M1SW01_9HYPH|nr:glucose/sorbosone family PQQ-dependent dehydrogenase [Devosia aurantiaca]NGP17121.1 L-sorbosone dehydrogenase [Devosia aurantiaca]
MAHVTRTGLLAGVAAASLLLAIPASFAQETPVEIERGQNDLFSSRVLTTALSNPWAMRWGPDGQIWLTERTSGEVTKVDPETGAQQVILTLDDVYTGPQHEGLLGMALHPEIGQGTGNDFVYIGYTINIGTETEPDASAQIVRYTYDEATGQLGSPEILIEGLPGGNDHNAGRVVIGPDMKLYYSIGEQGANFGRNFRLPNLAQALPTAEEVAAEDWHTYAGKILRLELDGSIPEDNPEIDGVKSHIFSYGHRNPQGLSFGSNGILYEAEHGPSSDDELNIIQPGGNYGWPLVAGYIDDMGYSYINWSEAPEGVERATTPPPEGVPVTQESEFEGEMIDPLATYFTVASDFPFDQQCGFICNPTVAPSSVLYYGGDAIPEWQNSILLPTLKHGVLYVQPLSEDGTEADGLPVAWLGTQNRYRDVLISEDGKTVYLATDAFGSVSQLYGTDLTTSVLHNPGAILKFTYGGEEGSSLAVAGEGNEAQAGGTSESAGGPAEWENPANQGATPGTDAPAATEAPAASDAPAADTPVSEAPAAAGGEADLATLVAAGQPKFVASCSGCHGVNGQGGAGAVLANNPNLADASHVASTIIHGLGYMPPVGADMSDEEVAEIGTYIRNSWGNDYGVLTVEEAAAER